MAENDYICGVNWSTMKKIAKFSFGADNVLSFRKAGTRTYVIYLEKKFYEEQQTLANYFEEFWHVTVKPMLD